MNNKAWPRILMLVILAVGVLLYFLWFLDSDPKLEQLVESDAKLVTSDLARPSSGMSGTPKPKAEHADDPHGLLSNGIETEYSAEWLAATKQIPVHEWHRDRYKAIASESIEQTIDHLANFDDLHLAQSGVQSLLPSHASAEFVSQYIPNLFRVRKLLSVMQSDPDSLKPRLSQMMTQSASDWEQVRAERELAYAETEAAGKPFTLQEPDRYTKTQVQSSTAMYLLAESRAFDELYTFSSHLELGLKNLPHSSPTPPGFTFLAAHQLISEYPESRLKSNARAIHDAYLALTDGVLIPPKIKKVARWDAPYDESDPRIVVIDPERHILEHVQMMDLAYYTTHLKNSDKLAYPDGALTEIGRKLVEMQLEFINAQHPK